MSAVTLTPEEKALFGRVAHHMANGMDMEGAIQAVRDDDACIARAFGCFRDGLTRRTPAQQALCDGFAGSVYQSIRGQS